MSGYSGRKREKKWTILIIFQEVCRPASSRTTFVCILQTTSVCLSTTLKDTPIFSSLKANNEVEFPVQKQLPYITFEGNFC